MKAIFAILKAVNRAASRRRFLSSGPHEASVPKLQAILRPFIFSVHPDLFGHYPLPKRVNEASLKVLHEYIQSAADDGEHLSGRNQSLKFYQKVPDAENKADILRLVKVQLNENLLESVRALLIESNLPLDDIDEVIRNSRLRPSRPITSDRPIDWIRSNYFAATGRHYPFTDIWEEITKLKPAITLHRWISSNVKNARLLGLESSRIRQDYSTLHETIIRKHSLKDIIWSCGWRGIYQLASLRSLDHILTNELQYQQLAAGKRVIFGNESGVSLNGDIVLCTDEVSQQWLQALSVVPASDSYLNLIPKAELQLSSLLHDIEIVRRVSPPVPMADAYYSSLASLISRFGMARSMSTNKRSDSLRHLQLTVTGTMGDEMTLTPEGHISVPSHNPVWAIRNFIRDNQSTAIELQAKYAVDRTEAMRLMNAVVEDYQLESLTIDSSISYDKVKVCCENLLASSDTVRYMLEGVRLCIAPYFAVMGDGEMCIMWDWVDDTS